MTTVKSFIPWCGCSSNFLPLRQQLAEHPSVPSLPASSQSKKQKQTSSAESPRPGTLRTLRRWTATDIAWAKVCNLEKGSVKVSRTTHSVRLETAMSRKRLQRLSRKPCICRHSRLLSPAVPECASAAGTHSCAARRDTFEQLGNSPNRK